VAQALLPVLAQISPPVIPSDRAGAMATKAGVEESRESVPGHAASGSSLPKSQPESRCTHSCEAPWHNLARDRAALRVLGGAPSAVLGPTSLMWHSRPRLCWAERVSCGTAALGCAGRNESHVAQPPSAVLSQSHEWLTIELTFFRMTPQRRQARNELAPAGRPGYACRTDGAP
jgi:hypothetical protein